MIMPSSWYLPVKASHRIHTITLIVRILKRAHASTTVLYAEYNPRQKEQNRTKNKSLLKFASQREEREYWLR